MGSKTAKRIGEKLRKEHGLIDCKKGYYSEINQSGNTPYHQPTDFPAVLFDPHGHFIIENCESMENNPHINIGNVRINVPEGINSLEGYVRCCEDSHE